MKILPVKAKEVGAISPRSPAIPNPPFPAAAAFRCGNNGLPGPPAPPSIPNGFPMNNENGCDERSSGEPVPPLVAAKAAAAENGMFIGADLGITSGLVGSRIAGDGVRSSNEELPPFFSELPGVPARLFGWPLPLSMPCIPAGDGD